MFKSILIVTAVMLTSSLQAREINWAEDWLKAERLTLDVSRFLFNRDPYAPDIEPKEWFGRVAVEFDLRLAPFIKWENMAHTEGDRVQVRTVGWQHAVVIDYFDTIQPYYFHHSRHLMEGINEDVRFPLEDRYGIRVNFLLPE